MKTSFLDYYKTILSKVSFDEQLLQKEYQKALNCLRSSDARELDSWISQAGLYDRINGSGVNEHSNAI